MSLDFLEILGRRKKNKISQGGVWADLTPPFVTRVPNKHAGRRYYAAATVAAPRRPHVARLLNTLYMTDIFLNFSHTVGLIRVRNRHEATQTHCSNPVATTYPIWAYYAHGRQSRCQEDHVSLPSSRLEKTTRSSPHHVAQHRPTGSETTPPYAPRSSRFGS